MSSLVLSTKGLYQCGLYRLYTCGQSTRPHPCLLSDHSPGRDTGDTCRIPQSANDVQTTKFVVYLYVIYCTAIGLGGRPPRRIPRKDSKEKSGLPLVSFVGLLALLLSLYIWDEKFWWRGTVVVMGASWICMSCGMFSQLIFIFQIIGEHVIWTYGKYVVIHVFVFIVLIIFS